MALAIGTPLRLHWKVSDTPFGRHLPTLAVTTDPTRLPPVILGRGVEVSRFRIVTESLLTDMAGPLDWTPVTVIAMGLPTSALTSR